MNKLISLCMIVKNEEQFLERCLTSVQSWVDEIIIVDTGSTDRTKEIAHSFTDSVYDFEWINDFAAARNEALKHATGTWILVLDADEYVEEQEIRGLRNFLANEKPTANFVYQINVRNFIDSSGSASISELPIQRIFANRMGLEYDRPIHEQIQRSDGSSYQVVALPYYILHSGYLNQVVASQNKHERNMAIFKGMMDKNELSDYDHSMLAQQFIMANQFEKASYHLKIVLACEHKTTMWYRNSLWAMLDVYLQSQQYIEAWDLFHEQMIPYLDYPDVRCVHGVILISLGLHEQAKQELLTALREAERRTAFQEDLALVSPSMAMRMPMWLLALIYERENNFNQSIYYLTLLLKANNQDSEAWIKIVEILSLNESPGDIAVFLDKLLDITATPQKIITMTKISIGIGNLELAQYYMDRFPCIDELSLSEQMKYSLLSKQTTIFEQLLQNRSIEEITDPTVSKMIILGSIVWSRLDWIEQYENTSLDDSVGVQFAKFVLYTQASQKIEDQKLEPGLELVAADVLCQLYALKMWDTFDSLIDSFSLPTVINHLANFFLSKRYIQPAIQYYQHLLEHNQLDATSCENLGTFHIIEGKTTKALNFWEQAILLRQKAPLKLFIQYCSYCDAPLAKAQMKTKMFEQYPEYVDSPLLKTL